MTPIYTAEALATGDGRNGHARSADGIIDLDLRIPTEMGGPGGAANPELLFAAGYAGCFHSALRAVAKRAGADATDSTVGARVSIGDNGQGGFSLAVGLEIALPNVPQDQAVELAEAAHQVCPYSNATRGNIDVELSVVDD